MHEKKRKRRLTLNAMQLSVHFIMIQSFLYILLSHKHEKQCRQILSSWFLFMAAPWRQMLNAVVNSEGCTTLWNSLKIFHLRCIPEFSSEGNCKTVTPVPWNWPAALTDKLFLWTLWSMSIVKIPQRKVDSSTLSPIIVKGFDWFW